MELIGSPILNDATRCCTVKKLSENKRINYCILLLDGHPGLFLLKNAFSLPPLLLTLRSAPCHHHPELLAEYNVITRSTTEALCNIQFDDNSWSQAKLPVWCGGLGLRTAADLALPVFMFSRAVSISLVNDILRQPMNKQEDDDEVQAWLDQNLVLPSNAHKQRNWDDIQCSSAVATLVPILNQHRLACFKAASRPDSGVWLNCVPNNSRHFHRRLSPYRRRFPRRAHCLYSSSMQMRDDGGHIRYSPFVVLLQRRAHSSPFRPKRRRSTWPFCSRYAVHA